MKNERNLEGGTVRLTVEDLGAAAYVKMHGFKCVGRKARKFYFEMRESEVSEFGRLQYDYSNSPMHEFDANIMSLKKMPEYLPE